MLSRLPSPSSHSSSALSSMGGSMGRSMEPNDLLGMAGRLRAMLPAVVVVAPAWRCCGPRALLIPPKPRLPTSTRVRCQYARTNRPHFATTANTNRVHASPSSANRPDPGGASSSGSPPTTVGDEVAAKSIPAPPGSPTLQSRTDAGVLHRRTEESEKSDAEKKEENLSSIFFGEIVTVGVVRHMFPCSFPRVYAVGCTEDSSSSSNSHWVIRSFTFPATVKRWPRAATIYRGKRN